MKRAIAMKCNQEQWDAVKGKLVGCEINEFNIDSFLQYKYLVNDYEEKEFNIGNTMMHKKREVHETWNEQIFLEACGIETVFKGSELQLWTGIKWLNCREENKYRLKPDYSKEIVSLENQVIELEKQIEILKNK